MTGDRRAFAEAAEELVGTAFRLHGRDPDSGVDCVGLVACALANIGRHKAAPAGYTLRNLHLGPFLPALRGAGFMPVEEAQVEGDLLVVRPSSAQFHLMIRTRNGGFVHAHAGLGRVVITPAPLAWPLVGQWRLAET